MSAINPWMLPKIVYYLDSQTNAVERFAGKVQISPDPEKDIKEIGEAVSEHTRALTPKWLLTTSYIFADDLYKTGNRLSMWADPHRKYLDATAGTFFQHFHEKGYVLRYAINN